MLPNEYFGKTDVVNLLDQYREMGYRCIVRGSVCPVGRGLHAHPRDILFI